VVPVTTSKEVMNVIVLKIFVAQIVHAGIYALIPLEFAKMKASACLPVTSLLSITAIATQNGKDEIVP
jgi:hypothetical protein